MPLPRHAVRIASAEEPPCPPRRSLVPNTAIPQKAAEDDRFIYIRSPLDPLPPLPPLLLKLDIYRGAGWHGGCGDRDVVGSGSPERKLYQ